MAGDGGLGGRAKARQPANARGGTPGDLSNATSAIERQGA